jgi:hypothetical protein
VDDPTLPSEAQLRALEALKVLISDSDGRQQYAEASTPEDKQNVFDGSEGAEGANYADLPAGARAVLEAFSEPELAHLSELDAAFVDGSMGIPLPSGRSAMVF